METIKGKCGRPNKKNSEDIEYEDEGHIATNQFALQLFLLISEMAIYKILTITGLSKSKNIKNRKEIEKEQRRIRQNKGINEEKVFFLRNFDVWPREYSLKENKIEYSEENTIFLEDFKDDKKRDFIKDIQCVFEVLNKETQYFLKGLITIYFQNNSLEAFEDQFFNSFRDYNDEYQEIKQWDELYEVSFDQKLEQMKKQLKEYEEKFELDANIQESKRKVVQKRIKVLQKQKQNIEQFQSIKKPNRPLKLFIEKIYQLFKTFSEQYNK